MDGEGALEEEAHERESNVGGSTHWQAQHRMLVVGRSTWMRESNTELDRCGKRYPQGSQMENTYTLMECLTKKKVVLKSKQC